MEIFIVNKSIDNTTLTLNNGRQFIVDSEGTTVIKNWLIGAELKIFTTDSRIEYNYEVTNLLRKETIKAAISVE